MKTINYKMKTLYTCIAWVVLMLNYTFGYSQSVLMTVKNMIQTNANTFEYDMFLKNTDSSPIYLKGYAWGINHTPGLANGGILTHSYIAGSRDLSLNNFPIIVDGNGYGGNGYNAIANQFRSTTNGASPGTEVLIPVGSEIKLARIQVQTSATSWPVNFNPFLPNSPLIAMQVSTEKGRAQCIVLIATPMGDFALIGTGNDPQMKTLQTLSAQIEPSPSGVTPFLLNVQPPLQLSLILDHDVTCNGSADGVVFASATGLSGNFVYDIDGGTAYTNTNGIFTGLAPGTHTICAKDIPSNIIACDVITIFEPDPIMVTLTVDAMVSSLGNDGTVSANVTGGTTINMPHIMSWSNNVTTYSMFDISVSGLSVGTYSVVAEDDNGCTSSASIILNAIPPIIVTASHTPITCTGSTSDITATSYGGTGTLTNTISGGSFTVVAGTYTITATDANGFTATTEIIILDATQPCFQLTVVLDQNTSCHGANDASVQATATGASGNFVYDIDGGTSYINITGLFFGLAPGIHTICAKEIPSNIIVCETITVTEPDPINVSLAIDANVSCLGNDGALSATVTGGTTGISPYIISWYNGVTTNSPYDLSVSALAAGTYTVVAEDNNACTSSATIVLNGGTAISVTASHTPIICNGGTSVITPSSLGGTGALTNTISGGSFTVGEGTYTITATDANGCTATTSITITEPPLINVGSTSSPSSTVCAGTSVTLNGIGANTYSWSSGVTDGMAFAINTTTTYTITGTDANGCTNTATKTITVNPLPIVGSTLSPSSTVCAGTSVTLNGNGASSYVWSSGINNGIAFTPLTSSTYTVTGTDVNGCINTASILITVNPLPNPTITGGTVFNGSGILHAGNYFSYLWSTGASTSNININTTGNYSVIVTDANGCIGTASQYDIVNAQAISSGSNSYHSAFLCAIPGIPKACGNNSFGQLGDGTSAYKSIAVQVSGLTGITAIAGGGDHSLFLKNDGTVWACGYNNNGQLGDGTTTQRTIPVQVIGLTGITAIAGGGTHSLFLKNDGTVWACGSNGYGQLGDGTTTPKTIPVQVSGLTGIAAIVGGRTHSLFLKNDGTVWACGYNGHGQLGDGTTAQRTIPVQVIGLTGISAITGGVDHSLFLKNDGTVWACGFNGSGQLGDGTTTNKTIAVQVSVLTGITAITGGGYHSLFLKNDGTVRACGANGSGQLGDGTTTQRTLPVQVSGLIGITAITGGAHHSLFLKNDATVRACGYNGYGQLGDGTTTNKINPVQIYPCCTNPSIPTLTATANPICAGGATTLSIASGNLNSATNWHWYTASCAGTFVGTGSTINVSPTSTTTYFARGEGGCVISGACGSITITVNQLPNVNASASSSAICNGSSTTLYGFGATNYSWLPSGNGTPLTVTPNATTTYTITGTDVSGCSKTSTVIVTVNPIATADPVANQTICNNTLTSPINFTGNIPTATYNWICSNPAIGLSANGTGNIPSFTAINNSTVPVTATITLKPVIGQSLAYITQNAGNSVKVINTSTNTVVASIAMPAISWGIGISPNGNRVYVSHRNTNYISVINAISNTVLTTVTVGSAPWGICVSPDGSRVYVTNNASNSVSVIDALSNTVTSTIPVQINPKGICISPDGSKVYVANFGSHTISIINTSTNAISATVSVPGFPDGLEVLPDGSKLYVANSGNVSVINTSTNTLTANISVPGIADGVSVSPDGNRVYVTNFSSNFVSVINSTSNSVIANISSPGAPVGISITKNGNFVYAANWQSTTISVIDALTNTITTTLSGFANPVSFGNFISGLACDGTPSTFTITVNPSPTITSLGANPNPVCQGSMATLSATSAGNIVWSGGVSNNIPFTPNASNIYTVTATDANSCTKTATVSVTVNSLPSVGATASITSTVCAGTSITLNGTGASTYVWSGGVTNNTPFIINSTTTFTVTGTDVNGCTKTATKTINVNPTPALSMFVSPSTTICAGTSVTLTAGGANSYTWSGGIGNGVAFTAPSGGSGPISTTYTVTGTDANGCTKTSSVTLVVNPLPTVSASASPSSSVCLGSSIALNAVGNASSYAWTGGVLNGVQFSPPASSMYTVSATSANGCTKTSSVNITVNPLPMVGINASLSSPICAGTSITLNGTGASSYVWTGGVINGSSFAPSSTNTYSVTGTDANGCAKTSTILFTVNPPTSHTTIASSCSTPYLWQAPLGDGLLHYVSGIFTHTSVNANGCMHTETLNLSIGGNLPIITCSALSPTICAGSSTNLTGFGGVSYTWAPGPLSGSTVNVTPTATTIYTVTGSNAGGCTSTATVTVIVNPIATVNTVANQIICNNGSSTAVNFSGVLPNTIYKWTNSNTAIGLAVSGIGNIPSFTAHNNGTTPITSTITVTPVNGNSYAYVANENGYVTPINTITNIPSPNINIPGIGIFGICVSPDGNTVYVTGNSVNVFAINTITNNVTTIFVGGIPRGICMSPDGSKVYVANATMPFVSVISVPGNTVTTIPIGVNSNRGISVSSDGNKLYVANVNGIKVINTITNAVSTISLLYAFNCIVHPNGTKLFVANGNNISIYNTANNALITTVTSGLSPVGLAMSPDGNKLYITNNGSNNVAVMNTNSYAFDVPIPVGTGPIGISLTPDGNKLFVANKGSANVSVIDLITSIVSTTIPVGGYPYSLGNFITGSNCQGTPITFTITVNPSIHTTTTVACSPYIWAAPEGDGLPHSTSGTFSHISTDAAGCSHTETLNLSIVNPNTVINETKSAMGCYTWPVNGTTYYASGNYTFAITTPCNITHNLNLTITSGIKLAAKVFLAGPYNTAIGLMNDDLRFKNLIPVNQPYIPTLPAYARIPSTSILESIPVLSPAILSVTGPNAIVDWVFLELRSSSNSASILRTKRALLQRDGDIVSCLDGTSPVFFENTTAGNYYICVRHRNHLGVMSANTLSLDPCIVATIDFTNPAPVYVKPGITSNQPRKNMGNGVMALWAGDANANKIVKGTGSGNDKDLVISLSLPTPMLNVYKTEDVNLDGNINQSGLGNDKEVITIGTLNGINNDVYHQHTPN